MDNEKTLEELRKLQKELESISKRINKLAEDCTVQQRKQLIDSNTKKDTPDMEKVVTDYLLQSGMSTSVLGFKYARTAIIVILSGEQEKRLCMTKRVYPEVAKRFNATSSRVESVIRHAIQRTYEKNEENVLLQEIMMHTHGCNPTNSEFLAFIAEKIRLES